MQARFGGDEFVLLIAGADEDEVERVLGRLARSHPASWTWGAVVCSDEESLDDAIERADAHLYIAKARRNDRLGSSPLEQFAQERTMRVVTGRG